ncbi:MAG: VCBS repeat-containing protein, partial [Thermoleophilia bacterium]|nr:VCBS repeat-containing protein [Thermoleophilia bacterium]
PGDFNGDGKADILWYGPGDAFDSMWYGTSNPGEFATGVNVTVKGTYIPVPGDFNGDRNSDVLWYGPGAEPDSIWFGQTAVGLFS